MSERQRGATDQRKFQQISQREKQNVDEVKCSRISRTGIV